MEPPCLEIMSAKKTLWSSSGKYLRDPALVHDLETEFKEIKTYIVTNSCDANGGLTLFPNIVNPGNPREFYILPHSTLIAKQGT
jgi:hypothetical protein